MKEKIISFNILVIDDDEAAQTGFNNYLKRCGYHICKALSLTEARHIVENEHLDAVLLDLELPDGNGLHFISELRERRSDLAIIVITGNDNVSTAVDAMRRGADNYLVKPVDMASLDIILKKGLEYANLRRVDLRVRRLEKKEEYYIGHCQTMHTVSQLAKIAAANNSPVLITGETGTGKGVLAKWIHKQGALAKEAFVEINCSSLKGDLLASELFGHVKGAFTSAVKDRAGLVEIADGGILFLDEIGDMDLAVQSQFLKTIEEKHYRRVGDTTVRRSEFRLICATNKNLDREVKEGKFRQDLFYRIHVFPIHLPPLRERREDIPPLAELFLRTMNYPADNLDEKILETLLKYDWPGNIRELKNILERAKLLANDEKITVDHLPGISRNLSSGPGSSTDWNLARNEVVYVKKAFAYFDNDADKTAAALGISRATAYRKIKSL